MGAHVVNLPTVLVVDSGRETELARGVFGGRLVVRLLRMTPEESLLLGGLGTSEG